MRTPDFSNILKVLSNEKPERDTLFEFFLNPPLYEKLTKNENIDQDEEMGEFKLLIAAFKNAGYDYVTIYGSDFHFPSGESQYQETISLNEGIMIKDRESFEEYEWPDPGNHDYSHLGKLSEELPEGMKIITPGPGGVLENVISLTGYENLCYMIKDDPVLAEDIFEAVGSRLVEYYDICSPIDTVGALISNDDWGFKTQTMLSSKDMRKYVFPWHKKIVETIHSYDKPVLLHSCGNLEQVMKDIINEMNYDGKHSYEDNILPVEKTYEKWGDHIAILGGIDVNFMCNSTPEEIKTRSRNILDRTKDKGGYALGTGNSVPEYIPDENYLAMISVVEEKPPFFGRLLK